MPIYYVFEYKRVDRAVPVIDEKEANQMLGVIHESKSGKIPLGYVDKHKVIRLFKPTIEEPNTPPVELIVRITKAIKRYLRSRAT